jgi:hypothetical protein
MTGVLLGRGMGLEREGSLRRCIKPVNPIRGRDTLPPFILPRTARRFVRGRMAGMLSVFAQCGRLEQRGAEAFVLPCLPSRTRRSRRRAEAAASRFASAFSARPSALRWALEMGFAVGNTSVLGKAKLEYDLRDER